nr:reverse transcriptase domain-containing protein [Tanacetum cinerariifolium]
YTILYTYLWWSFPTTRVITLVSRLHRLKLSMAENVDRLFVGLRLETLSSLVWKFIHETTKKIIHIKKRIQAVRDRQKSYSDRRHEPLPTPLDEIQIDDKLNFIEEPVEIIDREVKWLNQRCIPIGDGVVVRGDDDGGGGCSDELMMLARCGGLDCGDEPAVMAAVLCGGVEVGGDVMAAKVEAMEVDSVENKVKMV